jgi:hypothetical protein
MNGNIANYTISNADGKQSTFRVLFEGIIHQTRFKSNIRHQKHHNFDPRRFCRVCTCVPILQDDDSTIVSRRRSLQCYYSILVS